MSFQRPALMRCAGILVAITLAAQADRTAQAEEWPEFRGPTGQGHYPSRALPTTWSESEHIAWKSPIPGTGWSSPVIWGQQVWLTTSIHHEPDSQEAQARLEASGDAAKVMSLSVASDLELRALCIDRDTGAIQYDLRLFEVARPDPIHSMNSYASPTPVIEAGRVYCHFGTHGTAAIDTATGDIVWTNDELKIQHETGPGSSPILWNNHVIVHCDGSDVQYIVALDKETGKIAWKTLRSGTMHDNPQFKKAYGTPLMVRMAGRDVVVSPAPNWVYGYDPATGEELWKVAYGGLGFSNVPRPVAADGRLFVCSGFMESRLLALSYRPEGELREPKITWQFGKQVPLISSPLLIDSELYFVSDKGGVFSCLDAATGTLHYKERLGGNYAASPIDAGGVIYLSDREGTTHIIRPGTTFEQLAKNELESGCMASPACHDDALYLRTEKALYRIEN